MDTNNSDIQPPAPTLRHQDVNLAYPKDIEAKIQHLLKIYPAVSPSMMQVGLGPSLPSKIWKPVLRDLIERGLVKEDVFMHMTSTGRSQAYTVLSLKETRVTFPGA